MRLSRKELADLARDNRDGDGRVIRAVSEVRAARSRAAKRRRETRLLTELVEALRHTLSVLTREFGPCETEEGEPGESIRRMRAALARYDAPDDAPQSAAEAVESGL